MWSILSSDSLTLLRMFRCKEAPWMFELSVFHRRMVLSEEQVMKVFGGKQDCLLSFTSGYTYREINCNRIRNRLYIFQNWGGVMSIKKLSKKDWAQEKNIPMLVHRYEREVKLLTLAFSMKIFCSPKLSRYTSLVLLLFEAGFTETVYTIGFKFHRMIWLSYN